MLLMARTLKTLALVSDNSLICKILPDQLIILPWDTAFEFSGKKVVRILEDDPDGKVVRRT